MVTLTRGNHLNIDQHRQGKRTNDIFCRILLRSWLGNVKMGLLGGFRACFFQPSQCLDSLIPRRSLFTRPKLLRKHFFVSDFTGKNIGWETGKTDQIFKPRRSYERYLQRRQITIAIKSLFVARSLSLLSSLVLGEFEFCGFL